MLDLIKTRKVRVAAVLAAAAMSAGVAAAPASASPSLVDITIFNVLNNNTVTVTVPVHVAANVCVNGVIASSPMLTCTATAH